ncbi:MAG TPA: hypothetical protein VK919_02055 [Solirubrobacterales bacterium]|nr:hypothetical protein [Solirubrobacterales bacterium]
MTGAANGGHERPDHGHDQGLEGNPEPLPGASSEEMSLLVRIDAEGDRIVRGLPPAGYDPELAELADFVAELRAGYGQSPAEEVRNRHLEAILAAAHTSDGSAVAASRERARASTWITPARRGRAMAFRLAAIGLAAAIGVGGLAAAGVAPTGPVESALERIGIGSGSGDDGANPATTDEAVPPGQDRRGDRSGEGKARSGARGVEGRVGARGRGDERRSETGTFRSGPGRATAEEAAGGGTPPSSPGQSDAHRPDDSGPPASPGSSAGKGAGAGAGGGGPGTGTTQGKGVTQGSAKSQGKADTGLQRAQEAQDSAAARKP